LALVFDLAFALDLGGAFAFRPFAPRRLAGFIASSRYS